MYITPRQKRRTQLITAVLIIAIPLTVIAAYLVTRFYTGAAGDTDPKGVLISNVTSSSATISWTTDGSSTGSVTLDNNGTQSSPFIDVRGANRRKTHYVEVIDLDPETEYSFKILSNSVESEGEAGSLFKLKTAPITTATPVPNPIYGSLLDASLDDAVIYVVLSGSSAYPASAVINSGGNWILDLSALRNAGDTLVKVEADTEMSVIAVADDGRSAKVTGTYGELFDEDGQLSSSSVLSLSTGSDVLSSFPASSLISQRLSTTPEEEEPVVPSTPTPTVEEEPEEEEEEPVEETFERKFRLVSDVDWGVITATSRGTVKPDVVTGEESVQITNVTDAGFTVIWISESAEEGSILYGTSSSELTEVGEDERDTVLAKGLYNSHSVKLTQLQPETQYFFKVNSGSDVIDNGGSPFTVTTFATLDSPPEFVTVSGKVTGLDNLEDAVVVAYIEDGDGEGSSGRSTLTSAVSDSSGNWIITVGDTRSSTGDDYYTFSDGDTFVVSPTVYAESDPVEESAEGIEEKTVTIAVKGASDTRASISVDPLDGYGVYDDGSSKGGGGSLEENGITVPTGDTTPATAISTNLVISIISGVALLTLGSIFVRKGSEKRAKKSMLDSVL